mgnify:FL=1
MKLSPDVLDLNPQLRSSKARVKARPISNEPDFKSNTERKAWREWAPLQGFDHVHYEPFILHLTGGNYTPDIVGVMPNGEMWIIEVKGSWRAYQSGRTSKRNLKQAAIEFSWLGRFFSLMPGKRGAFELQEYTK